MTIITQTNAQVCRTDNETELVTDRRYQIGNTTKIDRIDTHGLILGHDKEDTDI